MDSVKSRLLIGFRALHALRMLLASLGFSLDRVNLVLEILASGQGSVQDIVEELVSYACRNPIRQLHNAVTNLAIEHINIKYIGLSFIVEADSLLEEACIPDRHLANGS